MKSLKNISFFLAICFLLSSCGNKQMAALKVEHEKELATANTQLGECGESLNKYMAELASCKSEKQKLNSTIDLKEERIKNLNDQLSIVKDQLADVKAQRDKQSTQVGDLTVLSQSANENIKETLSQLEKKDKYIQLIQAAKTKADSINLALAINLKGVLQDGIEDKDVEIKVDKTVVFVNLSDKMLYQSGSANLTPKANEVLGKIAKIIESRPDLEVMVEGYTDDRPINTSCMSDNWDLSVKRATSVVRVLQKNYGVNPDRLIAAGRGQYNVLASNNTPEGRAMNRRTRIIILPQLNQFYDLLNPANASN